MRIIIKKPGEPAEPAEIDDSLESYQATVGGYIEFLRGETFGLDDIDIVMNEEGKVSGLEPNLDVGFDVLCGTVFLVGRENGEEGFEQRGLSPEEVTRCLDWIDLTLY